MGICSSCLGSGRGDTSDVSFLRCALRSRPRTGGSIDETVTLIRTLNIQESSRLLDDEIYQPGYGYGALQNNNQANQPDPGNVRREREALEAICQRTSE